MSTARKEKAPATIADIFAIPEPERFLPDRFLGRTYTPFEYLPFGGGTRRCIGAAFATYELKIALATIMHHHELRLLPAGSVDWCRTVPPLFAAAADLSQMALAVWFLVAP